MAIDPLDELAAELPRLYEPVYLKTADGAVQEAIRRAQTGADEGTLVWVGEQTQGRGQRDAWLSPPGGLYSALILRPDYPRARYGELAAVASVSAGAAIAELAQPMTPLRYGWPNDLLLGGDRLGGIQIVAEADWLVAGLAVNVAPLPPTLAYASLQREAGATATAAMLLGRYARFFLDWVNRWAEEGFEPVARAWMRRGLLDDSWRRIRIADTTIEGRPLRITATGALVLETATGAETVPINLALGLS